MQRWSANDLSKVNTLYRYQICKGSLHLKKKKKYEIFHTWVCPPPPTIKNFSMYFFSETRPLLGHFLKKSVFCPPEMSNTCKNFQNPKIGQKWLSMGPPPFFSPKIFFTKMTQNGLKWILNTTLKSMGISVVSSNQSEKLNYSS